MKRAFLLASLALVLANPAWVPPLPAAAGTIFMEAGVASPAVASSVNVPPRPVPSTKPRPSSTKADCDALIARVRAGQQRTYPRFCIAGTVGGRTALDPWPDECRTTTGELLAWTAPNRRQACNHERIGYEVFEVPTGRLTGTATLHAVSKMVSSTSAAYWGINTDVWVWSWTGNGFPEWSTGTMSGCATYCYISGASYTKVTFDQWHGSGNLGVPGLATGQIVNNVWGGWTVTFGSSKWSNSVSFGLSAALSRCDNAVATRSAGCVFGNIPSTVRFSASVVPAFVDHVVNAQGSGLPGQEGSASFLTRLTDQTLTNANGNKACPSSIPRPPGKSCDEYPFRSTYQGAYTQPQGPAVVARSFPGCQMPDPYRSGSQGWSRCFIPETQNSSAGGTLVGFYRAERMLARDPFQVGFTS